MSFHVVSALVGWVAVALSTTTAYQQYGRVNRRGVEGVSFATWTTLLYISAFWVAYGVAAGSWQLTIGCAVPIPCQLLIWFRLSPRDHVAASVASLLVVAALCGLPALGWGWSGAVIGAGVAGWLSRARQLITLVQSHEARGVSTGSWLTAALVGALWVVYYAGAKLWPVLVVTAVSALVSLSIASLSALRHHRSEHATTPAISSTPLSAMDDGR